MSCTNLLETYFKLELKRLGYPEDLEICYSLNSCQGDGVAFYGSLDLPSLKSLIERLLAKREPSSPVERVQLLVAKRGIAKLLEAFEECGDGLISINRNGLSNQYSHFNTMDLIQNSDYDLLDYFEDGEEMELKQSVAAFDLFFSCLEEDIVNTSRKLESDGYQLLHSTPYEPEVVWERSTANYIVRVFECPEHWDDFSFYHEENEEHAFEVINDILRGDVRYATIKVEVVDKHTEQVLEDRYVGGVVFDKADKTYCGVPRDILAELHAELKDYVYQVAA